ncbi:hypothetical protein ARMSODRAFT_1016935 [Armillaria solidipes]|uniref:F-box domain-containing protein n=1 Tax=Armillaria solidipes TaxID=1076256 RepID=A0A2H3C551_9AGAR|nr:hypothetical protein ARMSODRAFT_1016935 [Armillaria solidipes]
MVLLSREILDKITDDCADDSLFTLTALRATSRCFERRSTTILFQGIVINGHTKSASSHTPSKSLRFFVTNHHLCHITKCLVFCGGEFVVDKVDAILRLLPSVTVFTLDCCSLTPFPVIAGVWPQIWSASILSCSVSNEGLRHLLQTIVGLREINIIASSFWGPPEPVPFPLTTSQLLLNLGGDAGEALQFVKAWARHAPSLRRLSCLCQTDAVIQELMPWITKCALTLEDVVIATQSRGGHWLTPITFTECKMLRKIEIGCVELNLRALCATLQSLEGVTLDALQINIHFAYHPITLPSWVGRSFERLDVLLKSLLDTRVASCVELVFHFYHIQKHDSNLCVDYANGHMCFLPKIRSLVGVSVAVHVGSMGSSYP